MSSESGPRGPEGRAAGRTLGENWKTPPAQQKRDCHSLWGPRGAGKPPGLSDVPGEL